MKEFNIGDRVYNHMIVVPEELKIGPADNWKLPIGWYTVIRINPTGISLDYVQNDYPQLFANYCINRFIKLKGVKNLPGDQV